MNFGNSIGGLTLMLLAIVWLAVFVPQWARRAQEPRVSLRERQRFVADRNTSALSSLELQMLRLSHTRSRMASVAVISVFLWIGVFFLTSGTVLGFLAWPIGAIVVVSALLSLAASRRLVVLAGDSRSTKVSRMAKSAKVAPVSLKAAPLARRAWIPNPMPEPIRERTTGEMVVRGAKVVPLVESSTAVESLPAASAEIQSAQIDEILRRRRAN